MKNISILLTLTLLFNINCFGQNSGNGYYKTYEDFKNNIRTEEGELDWIGQDDLFTLGPYFVHFKGNQKKDKIKGNPNWGCRISGKDYKFYKGKPYEILKYGKIMFYRIDEENRYYYSKENHEILTRIIFADESVGYYLFGDDVQVFEEFKIKIRAGGLNETNRNFLILITCIEKYNVRNK